MEPDIHLSVNLKKQELH